MRSSLKIAMDGNTTNSAGGAISGQVLYDATGTSQGSPLPPSFFSGKLLSILIGIVVVLLIIVVVFIFVLPRFKSSKSEKITLSYWGLWEDAAVFAPIIADFHRTHPNITIKYEKQDIKTQGKYVDRIRTRINNGLGPDLYRFHNSWLIQLNGFLLPLPSDVLSATELDTKYFNVVKRDLKKDGAYYGIPLSIDTLCLFINNAIFQAAGAQPPRIWNDFFNTALHLTVKEEATNKIITAGAALGTYDNVAHAADIISLIMVQNGADLKNLSGPTRKNVEAALTYYTLFNKDENRVWDDTLDNSKLAFAKGNLAMYFGYSWDILEIKAINPNLDFQVVSVPQLPGGKADTIASYWADGVSSKTKHPKEAFEFLKFLASRSSLEKIYAAQVNLRRFGSPYPRRDMTPLLKSTPLIYSFVKQADTSVSTLFSSDTYDANLDDSLNGYLANAVRSIIGNTASVESAVDTLANSVNQSLNIVNSNSQAQFR